MRYLMKFAVVVSVKKTEELATTEVELIKLVFEDPDRTIEEDSQIEFRWGYDSRDEAEAAVKQLNPLFPNPEIISVKMTEYGDMESSIIFKETRYDTPTSCGRQ
jgi:hypothetical protein